MSRVMWAWGCSVYGYRGVSESKDIVCLGEEWLGVLVSCVWRWWFEGSLQLSKIHSKVRIFINHLNYKIISIQGHTSEDLMCLNGDYQVVGYRGKGAYCVRGY